MTLRENPAVAALLGRRSIRRFESREVEEERISLLLECACAAPSAAGTRPWHFVVVRDRGRLDALAQAHPYGKMLFQAPLAVVVCGDPEKSDLARLYWEEDCSAAMENLLVAAHALGLGGVWLGVQHTPQREAALRVILSIPETVRVLGVAALGYPGEAKAPHSGWDEGSIHRDGW